MFKWKNNQDKWIQLAELDEKTGKIRQDQLPPLGLSPEILVSAPTGSTVVATSGASTVTAEESGGFWSLYVPSFGTWTVIATKGADSASEQVEVLEVKRYPVALEYSGIYGVEWDGTSTTKWHRTEKAISFTDPVPYLSGMTAAECYSPFDNILPWAGMNIIDDAQGGKLVAIPKFWYKLEKVGSGMSIKISNAAADGYSVSPAHMNRGDGQGERDIVYIGRYHCATSTYKSTSGVKPQASKTRSDFRTSIHSLGTNIYQMDLATRFTLWLLYIVEFADWNSQKCIGYGCGNNSATENMGYTDSMPYHTGTTQSSRTTYGCGTQYRNIEGLWDNVFDWFDGCYNNSSGLNIILNPANFSDTTGGTLIGKPSDGYPSAFNVSTSGGFPMFYPTAASGSDSTYSCDVWYFDSSDPCVYGGGSYFQDLGRGLFFVSYSSASYSVGSRGARLMKL